MTAQPLTEPTSTEHTLDVNAWLRTIAGFFVMLSLVLGTWVHPGWYLFTAFVGLNLFQSGLTGWCPMMTILRWMAVRG